MPDVLAEVLVDGVFKRGFVRPVKSYPASTLGEDRVCQNEDPFLWTLLLFVVLAVFPAHYAPEAVTLGAATHLFTK